jgi:hypothetical protein
MLVRRNPATGGWRCIEGKRAASRTERRKETQLKARAAHAELYVANPDQNDPVLSGFTWTTGLGRAARSDGMLGMGDGKVSVRFFPTDESQRAQAFNRDATGIGHLGLYVDSAELVDEFVREYMEPQVPDERGAGRDEPRSWSPRCAMARSGARRRRSSRRAGRATSTPGRSSIC